MRLRDILPELIPQAGQRWIELARSVPPYDPQQLLAYVSYVERAAEAGNAAAITMLGLLDDMLRALVGAGVNGRIVAKGLIGAAVLPLEPSHWLLLDGLPAEILRCAVNIGHNRIHLPGETAWIDAEWDSGSNMLGSRAAGNGHRGNQGCGGLLCRTGGSRSVLPGCEAARQPYPVGLSS